MTDFVPPRSIAVLLASALLGCSPPATHDDDYLAPELRGRVEQLKARVAAEPTSAASVHERTETLWRWGNAFALTGGTLPVVFPTTVRTVAAARTEQQPPPPRVLEEIDLLVREIARKEERPESLGTWRVLDDRALVAASWVTVEQEYTVGSEALESGAAFLAGQQIMADQGQIQNQDPTADHYVSIRSSAPGARFEALEIPRAGIHSSFAGGPAAMPAFRLVAGTVASGETVTVTFGDRSGGSRGLEIQTLSVEGLLLPVYVDPDGSGDLLTFPWPSLTVVGRPEVRSLRAFVPSIVAPGEAFGLTVRSEDSFGNRPSGPIPAYEVLLDDQPWRTLAAGSPALQVITGIRLEEEGIHRFTLRSADGTITGAANPVWVRQSPEQRIYWGETHGHCGFAEGQGEADAYYRFGRDDARLDFLTLSEHDAFMDDWEWRRLQELTRKYHEDGRFITYLGYEWSANRRQGGHHNVLFRSPGRRRVGVQTAPVLPLLYAGLHAENEPRDVLIIPHAHNAADWTQSDAGLERLVEIASGHGTFEWFGNLYLKSGFEVGFIAATDDHRTKPGYGYVMRTPVKSQRGGIAGVWAATKSNDAIFDAMRSLSAYATTGQRVVLEAHLNGFPMGTRQPHDERREIVCRVAGTSPIDRIEVVKNGTVLYSQRYLAAPLRSHSSVQIGFLSSSEVFFPPHRDNPRLNRIWEGWVEVEGARIVAVGTPGFDNFYVEGAEQVEGEPGKVRFHVETRGRTETLLLGLEGASASTSLRFHLEPTMEEGMNRGYVRQPAEIPGADFTLSLADLEDGRHEQTFQVDDHLDSIQLQVIDPNAAMDRELTFTDLQGVAPGDYYYVRVTQLDGGMAFSSPFWVGSSAEADSQTTAASNAD